MSWETFYLVCFLVGLLLSVFSLLGGMGHFGGHVHLPHAPHAGHIPHVPHGMAHTSHLATTSGQGGSTVPWWNAFSIMIFLCWFGAAGYLLTRYGGAILFFFLAKVMLPHERELTADDTPVVGVVGRVSSPIRADGTGEIVYQQMGAVMSAAARSEDGEAIEKEEEVYVIRYEKGIAYVKRWEELETGDHRQLTTEH